MLSRQELQQKREERRQRENEIADQEIAFLKASGKVSTKPSNVRRRTATNKLQSRNAATKSGNDNAEHVAVNTDAVSKESFWFTQVT